MSALDGEQQAALLKFKQDVLGAGPAAPVPITTPAEPRDSVRQQRPSRPKPAAGRVRPKNGRPSVLFSEIVKETRLPWQELVRESRNAGIRLDPMPGRTRLFAEEAEYLRRWAALNTDKPPLTVLNYIPDPEGRITLEDYDRLEAKYRAKLLVWGFLPVRKELKSFPNRAWAGIVRHHRRLEVLRIEKERAAVKLQPRAGVNDGSQPETEAREMSRPVRPEKTPNPPAAAVSNPLAAEIKRQLDARRHRREVDPESKPEPAGGQIVRPQTAPTLTSLGPGNPAVEELQQTLSGFAPKDHPMFFDSLAAALELDERIAREISADSDRNKLTERAMRSLIGLVCKGKFGLFAYHDVSNTLRSAARRNSQNSSSVAMKNALTNLRPMHTGVLTDTGKSRFIFWHVEKDGSQLAIVTFGAMSDWVRGMGMGQFVPLRGRLVTVSRHVTLTTMDREDAQFMIEAALKLRKGIHVRHTAPAAPEPRGRNYLDGRTPSRPRPLTYKPHSDWLIPVVVEDGFATAGLQEGFFSNYGGRSAHEVRPFMRRAPGTSWNAPKTVQVSAHTRGGYEVGDIGFMPTVTIMREVAAHST